MDHDPNRILCFSVTKFIQTLTPKKLNIKTPILSTRTDEEPPRPVSLSAYRAKTVSLRREPPGCGFPSCTAHLQLRGLYCRRSINKVPSRMGHPGFPAGFCPRFHWADPPIRPALTPTPTPQVTSWGGR